MKRKSLLFVLPVFGMALAGCTVNPDYKKPGEEEQHEEDHDEVVFTVEEEVTLGEGQTHKIVVTASGGSGAVTYQVTDGDDVISVDASGTIAGLAAGEGVVTVSYNGQEKYCSVTVLGEGEIVHVEKITVDTLNLTLKVGETHQVVTTIEPENATNKGVSYLSENDEICTVSASGLISAVAKGSTTVKVTSEDNAEKAKTINVTVLEPVQGDVLSVDQAIALMEEAGEGVVVEGLRQVKGVCAQGTTYDSYQQYTTHFDGHDNFELKFTDKSNILNAGSPDGMEITVEGYLEKYEGKYKLAYLPASVSPTGAKFTPNLVAAEEVHHDGLLTSISVSEAHREFTQGKPFVPETVTAHYGDLSFATVTAQFSGYDMNTPGDQTVTVSYTEGEITVTTTYSIHVTEKSPVVGGAVYTFTNDKTFAQNMNDWTSDQFMTHVSVEGSEIITGMKDQSNAYIGANGGSGDAQWNIWNCLKVGKSAGQGSITLLLDSTASFTSIKFSVIGSRDDGTLTVGDVIQNVTKKAVKDDLEPMELEYVIAGGISELTISSKAAASGNYAISILSIEFVQGDTPTPPPATPTLSSIALSGTHKTTFDVGETFSYEGLIVTASYSSGSPKTVTPTSVSTPDMTTAGTKTVTVSYTEGTITETATYSVTVSESGGGGGQTESQTATIVVADYAAPNFTTTGGAFTTTAEQNGGQSSPTYNSNGKDIRLYAKNTFKVTATSGTMTQIVFNISTQGLKRLTDISSSVGSAVVADDNLTVTWTGSASEVTFTVGDFATHGSEGETKLGQLDFVSFVITYTVA